MTSLRLAFSVLQVAFAVGLLHQLVDAVDELLELRPLRVVGGDVVEVHGARAPQGDDARVAQDLQVVRHGGAGEVRARRDLAHAHAAFLGLQQRHDDLLARLVA